MRIVLIIKYKLKHLLTYNINICKRKNHTIVFIHKSIKISELSRKSTSILFINLKYLLKNEIEQKKYKEIIIDAI